VEKISGNYCVPFENPRPDAARFVSVIKGDEKTAKPPMIEYLVDKTLMKPILASMGRQWADYDPQDGEFPTAYLDNFIEFWYRMGYDFVRFEQGLPFAGYTLSTDDTAPGAKGERAWADEHRGPIMSWEDFENYSWPVVDEFDFRPFQYIDSHLPDGMGLIVSHGGGVYEHLTWMLSYEGLCLALYDNPDLVKAVVERIGALTEQFYERLLTLKNLIAIFPGDDMGFRTSTLVNPDDLRTHVLPWHRRFAEMAHERGVLYFLHSCGNILAIIDDLIDYVGLDGKHSFEDAIIPVAEFHGRYHDRVASLGGVDVHALASLTPDELRRYVREVIDACAPLGRFAVGSGSSVPSYVSVENYLTMLDEALR